MKKKTKKNKKKTIVIFGISTLEFAEMQEIRAFNP